MQNVINSYSDAIMPNYKYVVFFVNSVPKGMEMKDINSKTKGERIHLKLFLCAK